LAKNGQCTENVRMTSSEDGSRGPFGWLYERCTSGASAPGSECFIQALPSVGDHKTPLPPLRQEEGALDLAADLSPFRASGVSVQSLRSSPRCIALGDRALVSWRKGTCGANGSQA
jgi:hypothetical protein